MTPRERVFAALEHREPDRIPWGEHSIDYNVYEDILGRETFVQAKMKEAQAYWDGRREPRRAACCFFSNDPGTLPSRKNENPDRPMPSETQSFRPRTNARFSQPYDQKGSPETEATS